MTKSLRKSEKLDLILSELSKVRADIAKLLKRQSDATAQRRSVRAKEVKKAPAKGRASPKAGGKPVLVEVPPAEHPRAASRSA